MTEPAYHRTVLSLCGRNKIIKLMVSCIFQELLVTEEMEGQPASMNAFELISMNEGLNLGNFFESDKVRIFLNYRRVYYIMSQFRLPA